MDNGGKVSRPNDESQKDLSITLAASSMINASDIISPQVYQANLKRIQEVKEMVRMLELNNEAAHKNYVVEQLEKRAQEGREAEDMLARLKSQPGIHETVQLNNNVPGDRAGVILPTTASVVEVSDSRISPPYSSSAPQVATHSSRTIQQTHPGPSSYQRIPAPPPIQQHQNDFRYYTPHQHDIARHSQANINAGHMHYYPAQNVPPQAGVYNPSTHPHQTTYQQLHVQQPLQSRSGYPHQTTAPLGTTTTPGQTRPTPTHSAPSVGSSNSVYYESAFTKELPTFRPSYNTHNTSTSLTLTSQVQAPLQSVPTAPPTQAAPAQHPSTSSHLEPVKSQPRNIPTSVPKLTHGELQPSSQQHRQSQQTSSQPQDIQQSHAQPSSHQSQQPPRSQQLPQISAHSQHAPQSHAQLHQPQQPPQIHLQCPPQLPNRVSSTPPSRPPNQPTQPIAQERRREYSRADQETFIKLFHNAVYRGPSHLKAFWIQAQGYGISEEWFKVAISSLPGDVWQSVQTQILRQGSATSAATPANVPQQQTPPNPGPNAPVTNVSSTPTVISLAETAPATQQVAGVGTSTNGEITKSAPAHLPGSYAAPLQYYAKAAEQATNIKSSLALRASFPMSSTGNSTPTLTAAVAPSRDVSQVHVTVRTPKDANKSTLAQDILRSLGRALPKSPRGTGIAFTDKTNKHEDDQKQQEAPLRRVSATIPSTVPNGPTARIDVGNSPSTSSIHGEAPLASPSLSDGKPALPEEPGQSVVIEGPIMIDLTLEDSEDSVDIGQGRESTLASADTTASQPVHSTNAANDSLLMENLSLEELSVDVTADDGNHSDVRMNSPPSPLAPETNVESSCLLPQPDSDQPVVPSFEVSQQEKILRPRDDQLPLFLPSPPTSPVPTEPPETDLEMIYDEGERLSLKRRSVSVDEVEVGGKLASQRVKKHPRKQVYVLIPTPPLYVRKAMKRRAMGEGLGSGLEERDEESQYSHLEQILIEESKSRLLERRCRWLNCASILNCAANLLSHLKNHVREDWQTPFYCRWAACQRRFLTEQECILHLEKHTTTPLPCPFAGCDERFDKPVEVMQHEVQHQRAEPGEMLIRKPTCEPIVPAIPARLGAPPRELPSHFVIPRRVFKCRISADRHAVLGPWILWNIFSPVEPDMRKQNASMRGGRPVRQAIVYDINSTGTDARRDDYDFLLALTSYPAKSRQLDDLDSAHVTMSAARGLTLWGSGSESHVNLAAESATPGETRDAVSDAVAVDAATITRTKSMSEGLQSGPPLGVGEAEDVVELLVS